MNAQIEFSPDLSPLTEALVAPNTNGGEIRGVGNGDWEKHPLHRGLGSWVYPETPTAAPLITLTGTNWNLHDFSLHGCEPGTNPPVELPAAGILVKFKPGVGTGGHSIERVNLSDLAIGLRFGDVGDRSMCDTTSARKLNVKRVDYAAYVGHAMAMQNNFEAIVGSEVRKALIAFEDGGNSSIENSSLTTVRPADGEQVAFLKLGFPGSNCWTYRIANCKIDRQCGNDACWLDMDKPIGGTVTLTACHTESGDYGRGKYLWRLHDAIRITITGGSNLLQRHSVFVKKDWANFNPPTIIATNHDNCVAPEDMVAPGSAPVFIKCVDCGVQQSGLPGRRMMNFSFANFVDRSKEPIA